jgi:hypothetical protein
LTTRRQPIPENKETPHSSIIIDKDEEDDSEFMDDLEEIEEKCININTIDKLFEFKICGLESFNKSILKEIFNTNDIIDKPVSFYVEVELYFSLLVCLFLFSNYNNNSNPY